MSLVEEFGVKFDLAWRAKLPFEDLVTFASQLESTGLGHLAASLYQLWVEKNSSPYAHAIYFNLGVTLTNLNDLVAAEVAYRHAIQLSPDFLQPRLNLGLIYERQGRADDAIQEWRWIQHQNGSGNAATSEIVVLALNHMGRLLETKKRYQEAVVCLTASLELNQAQPDVLHHWIFLRQKQCAWPVYQPIEGVSQSAMRDATSALAMIAISDDPKEQLTSAQHYVQEKVTSIAKHLQMAQTSGYGHSKIRIGYCSSDFCLHPVSLLTVELFELHNRDKFEVVGYCWSPEDGSALRQRVIASMDHFHRIRDLSDEDAARLIRSHEVDILIDLQGQTSGARANMLAYRPAPIQITYLGLPATTGLPSIDYVIADEFLIPPASASFYSEKPLYLPDIYQVSDRKRLVSHKTPTRSECGLPEDGFVFCSFNNSFKYTPEMFGVWVSILKRVPGSVLWLLADNEWAEKNLRHEAEMRGISPARLVFANRVAPENYLARYRLVDLFLDTFPFNAGTTANDCLWMGCPLLTMSGRSFASRMAGALLTAAKLPELITYTLQDYENMAISLANDAARCDALRKHLAHERERGVLFDTPRFVLHLEQRLKHLVFELAAQLVAA